jgi:hypothetical protein
MSRVHDITALFESHSSGEIDINDLEQEVKEIVLELEEELTVTSEALSVLDEDQN